MNATTETALRVAEVHPEAGFTVLALGALIAAAIAAWLVIKV